MRAADCCIIDSKKFYFCMRRLQHRMIQAIFGEEYVCCKRFSGFFLNSRVGGRQREIDSMINALIKTYSGLNEYLPRYVGEYERGRFILADKLREDIPLIKLKVDFSIGEFLDSEFERIVNMTFESLMKQ